MSHTESYTPTELETIMQRRWQLECLISEERQERTELELLILRRLAIAMDAPTREHMKDLTVEIRKVMDRAFPGTVLRKMDDTLTDPWTGEVVK